MRGAGGTQGGLGQFIIGLVMMIGGFFLLFSAISVHSSFGMGMRLYGFSAFGANYGITSGMVMIPFMFGIGIIFFNAKNVIGWLLAAGALVALIFGVISSIQFNLRAMNAFELITILVLSVGGLGLFLRSLRGAPEI